MGVKKLKINNGRWKIILGTIFLCLAFLFNNAYASNDYNVVRVGITDNKFQNVTKHEIVLYGTAECELCDKVTKTVITRVTPDTDIKIKTCQKGLIVEINGHSKIFQDLVLVCPQGLLGIRDLFRKGQPALYHGAFEIVQNSARDGFYIVNGVKIIVKEI